MRNSLNLNPDEVFFYFEELCKIPHGSGNTKAVSDYCVNFAKAHNLEYHQDEINNVIIIKEATPGYEKAEPIIIQGHLDMVCEKEEDCNIDFEKDGLELYVDGDLLKARGTTLGGDDGIAIAFGLALLEKEDLEHPRMEMIFTVDEETGMDGVQGIDLSPIKGHIMLNIDSDEEGIFLTSCAGGAEVNISLPVERQKAEGTILKITVNGLVGGHSGAEIHKERGNANKLIARVLKKLYDSVDFKMAELAGGQKHNAITRMAYATIVVDDSDVLIVNNIVKEIEADFKNEYRTADKDVFVSVEKLDGNSIEVIDPTSLTKIIFLLREIPYGVQAMSVEIPDLVETSMNLGISKLEKDAYNLCVSIRSSVSSRKYELVDRVIFLGEFLGADASKGDDYPAWEYKKESVVRGKIADLYKELFNEEPQIKAIHAGLECGYFDSMIKNLDAVSFGPANYDIHTPQERLSISSTEKYWKLLVEFLRRAK
ncbi:MAG: aminoacyl-histidine dipeptidase [Lachnospiraceae bacterium]|nr:aminoacyl-histidine dipeptidase [Lachnospiraceae bacterium]